MTSSFVATARSTTQRVASIDAKVPTWIADLGYNAHLFQERQLRSVTANTRADGEEFLAIAEKIGIHVTTTPYTLENADLALRDLAADRVSGAAVLHVAETPEELSKSYVEFA